MEFTFFHSLRFSFIYENKTNYAWKLNEGISYKLMQQLWQEYLFFISLLSFNVFELPSIRDEILI